MCVGGGYGIFLGVAAWLIAPYYKHGNKVIRIRLIANGMVSIAAVGLMIFESNWVLTSAGLSAYIFWNVLMIVLMILIYYHVTDSKKSVQL